MKTRLLFIVFFAMVLSANAQMDTLSAHCHYSNLDGGVLDLAAPIDSGFIIGNNYRGYLAHMQYFDATLGVTGPGTIDALAFATPSVSDAGGSVTFAIWPDNNGQPDYTSPLGTENINLSAIVLDAVPTDPSETMLRLVDDNIPYNNIVTFTTPVSIPATGKFWAGFICPVNFPSDAFGTGLSIEPNGTANTQSGAINSNGNFEFCYQIPWGSPYSIMIYPIVHFTSVGINEQLTSSSVYPNPTTSLITISANEPIEAIQVISLDGKMLLKSLPASNSTTVSLEQFQSGTYIIQATINGIVQTMEVVKQ